MTRGPFKWLMLLLVFDVVVIAWLVVSGGETDDADLVFASSSGHNFLDPQRLSASNDIRLAENLFEPLLRIKIDAPGLPPEPATAAALPEVTNDAEGRPVIYAFTIRDDAKWSNGEDVTSHDFIYAWRRALMPDFDSEYSYILWKIKGAEEFYKWRQEQLSAYLPTGARDVLLTTVYDAMKNRADGLSKVAAGDLKLNDVPPLDAASEAKKIAGLQSQLVHHKPYDTKKQLAPAQAALEQLEELVKSLTDANLADNLERYETLATKAAEVIDTYDAEVFASHRTPETARKWLNIAFDRFNKTVGVQAIDDKKLRVTLASPTPYFLYLAAFITYAPVHEASVEKFVGLAPDATKSARLIQDARWTSPGTIVTNGPYILNRRRFKRDVLLTQNPHYWNKANMRNTSILEIIVGDPQTQLAMYNKGRLDWVPDIPSSTSIARDLAGEMAKGKRNDVHMPTTIGTYYYNFNCKDKELPSGHPNPFLDPRVRRAFSMAIDRKTIVEKVNGVGQVPAYSFTPPGAGKGYDPPVEHGVRFDPEGARKLLAEAGFPDGKGLPPIEIFFNSAGGHEGAAQFIQVQWQQVLNAEVTLRSQEWPVFQEERKRQKYDVARGGWIGDYPDPVTFLDLFLSGSNHNDAGYNNPEVDRLFAEASKEVDPAKRMAKLREAEIVVLKEQPVAPILYYVWFHLYDPGKVKNMNLNNLNSRRLEFVEVVR